MKLSTYIDIEKFIIILLKKKTTKQNKGNETDNFCCSFYVPIA